MNFDFTGWPETPVEMFDQERWLDCLHAVVQALNVANDPQATQRATEDTGVLHEIAHLAAGVETWTHRSRDELRAMVAALSTNAATQTGEKT